MMKYARLILLFLAMLLAGDLHCQDLPSHQWKDRLILVITSDTSSSAYHDQLKILQSEKAGMKERKLVIYKSMPDQYQVGTGDDQWTRSNSFYHRFKRTDSDLEILLIGLDGRVKLRQSGIITTEKLFATIDAMPMRKYELSNKD